MDDVGSIVEPTSSLAWADVIHADFQTVQSRYLQNISTYFFSTAERMLRSIIMQNSRLIQACFPWGLNRPISRPLWLMTSAAAHVISVPSVYTALHIFGHSVPQITSEHGGQGGN